MLSVFLYAVVNKLIIIYWIRITIFDDMCGSIFIDGFRHTGLLSYSFWWQSDNSLIHTHIIRKNKQNYNIFDEYLQK